MQVKQKDKTGRADIDAFETAMRRAKCDKGFFVSFDYSSDAMREIDGSSAKNTASSFPLRRAKFWTKRLRGSAPKMPRRLPP
jgi:hypothetical protein